MAPAAFAQTDDFDKFSISLGVFFADQETDTRFDSDQGIPDPPIDLEDQLGLSKSDSVFRIDGYFRFAKKHQIDFSAFDLTRTASVTIEEEFVWDGTTYPVQEIVNSDFGLKIYKLDYTWRFLQRDNGFMGVAAGLYVADFDITIDAVNGGMFDSSDITAPLPVIGLRGQYDFSEKWSLRAAAEVFALNYDDYSGRLYDYSVAVDYGFSRHVAIGVGFNSVKMDIGVASPELNGDLDWQYAGALAYLKFGW